MNSADLRHRTKAFALQMIDLVKNLPGGKTADILGKQLLRSATSVGANYWSACRAKSPADLIAKMGIVHEEADESLYWLELLMESGIGTEAKITPLLKEADG